MVRQIERNTTVRDRLTRTEERRGSNNDQGVRTVDSAIRRNVYASERTSRAARSDIADVVVERDSATRRHRRVIQAEIGGMKIRGGNGRRGDCDLDGVRCVIAVAFSSQRC